MNNRIAARIAEELTVQPNQVVAAIALLDEGATVPFVARYRKEVTGGLDDTQLRHLEERLRYLRELDERRETIIKSIDEQGKLTDELAKQIQAADTKTVLEDLYLPYKPKRRTKAQIAREAGLEPLADSLFNDPSQDPETVAAEFIDEDKGVADSKQALDGARQILMERIAENAALLGQLRDYLWEQAEVHSVLVEGKEEEGAKFADYFDYHEALQKLPSHRALALFRGRNEGILRLTMQLPDDEEGTACEAMIARQMDFQPQDLPADKWLQDTMRWAWKFKLRLHLDVELLMRVREAAEEEAIRVFASNLQDLLLAAPAGQRATIGLDPGLRTGVKYAVVDNTGKLIAHGTIYPHPPKNQWKESIAILAKLATDHQVELISIGNGTASRETDKLVSDMLKQHSELKLHKIVVSEAGASVYSASEFAAKEFPELDVSIRGAVSIARRLQDPLAELVKIEPKSIGVGQYQHDVNQTRLARMLDAVVEDCVNAVGVDVNMASAPLLTRVAGLSSTVAQNIVAYRDEHGAFSSRAKLKDVPRMGTKTFEQAAGFLRISNGENPLDASAVHPETYPLVERILEKCEQPIRVVLGNSDFLRKLKPEEFTDEQFGIPTINDILQELEKPGRDPRPEFKTAAFKEGVEKIADLKPDMILEGVVTNVTNFGAFVDVGVHQDGLVHMSMLSNSFVKDPREVVKAGEVVKVKVLEVDEKRKRIALTMRLQDSSRDHVKAGDNPAKREARPNNKPRRDNKKPQQNKKPARSFSSAPPPNTAMGSALAEALANAKKR